MFCQTTLHCIAWKKDLSILLAAMMLISCAERGGLDFSMHKPQYFNAESVTEDFASNSVFISPAVIR